jgi:FkbH-like protein
VDNLRLADLQAASVRDSLVTASQSIEDYWQTLQVELDFHVNPSAQLVRLCELSQKTNQFNLTLARLNEVELSDYLSRQDCIVASIHLRDRLSDSGTIGLIVGERIDEALVIREICISCRALGRHLEDIMIGCVLDRAIDLLATKTVIFKYQKAPRNDPALKWLQQFTKVSDITESMEISLDNRDLPALSPDHLSALKINTYHYSRSI